MKKSLKQKKDESNKKDDKAGCSTQNKTTPSILPRVSNATFLTNSSLVKRNTSFFEIKSNDSKNQTKNKNLAVKFFINKFVKTKTEVKLFSGIRRPSTVFYKNDKILSSNCKIRKAFNGNKNFSKENKANYKKKLNNSAKPYKNKLKFEKKIIVNENKENLKIDVGNEKEISINFDAIENDAKLECRREGNNSLTNIDQVSNFLSSPFNQIPNALPAIKTKFQGILKSDFIQKILEKLNGKNQKIKKTLEPRQESKNLWDLMREKSSLMATEKVIFTEHSLSHNLQLRSACFSNHGANNDDRVFDKTSISSFENKKLESFNFPKLKLNVHQVSSIYRVFNFMKRCDVHDLFARFSSQCNDNFIKKCTKEDNFLENIKMFFVNNLYTENLTDKNERNKTNKSKNKNVILNDREVITKQTLEYFLCNYQEEEETEATSIISVTFISHIILFLFKNSDNNLV